ncbi:cytochrome P450 [Cyathus striatus]|nr:cytochrome P450 [Cyathus striatus]
MPSNTLILFDAAASILGVITVYVYLRWKNRSIRKLPLPPGPRRLLPFIGNALDIPSENSSTAYIDMGKKYNSDIIYLSAFGTNIVVLNSYETAKKLLENRSAIHSSRPRAIMLRELGGYDYTFGMFPYDTQWRAHRRLFTQYLHPIKTEINQPREIEYLRVLLKNFLEDPDNFLSHVRRMSASIAVSSVYGLKVTSEDDPYVTVAERALKTLNDLLSPTGSYLVETFPLLKMVPEWFPGAEFQRIAKKGRKDSLDLKNIPFAASMEAMRNGTILPSFVYEGLADVQNRENIDYIQHTQNIKEIAVMAYLGAVDTTYGSITIFILAMMKHPEVQKAAQRELDLVLDERLPEHDDIPSIPYVTALLREVLRWEAIVPMGLPHCSTEDDMFRGYYIPAGTIILPNQRGMLYDERDYPDPHVFRPERFLKAGQLDDAVRNPEDIAFGFGRRICPGLHLAKSSLWITMASILSLFNIEKPINEDGNVIEPTYKFDSTGVTHPEPFSCSIKPRSKRAVSILKALSE